MNVVHAIILGAIQGITEFIPISSSAHLVIASWLFGWKTPGLVFDASLHLGTLIALVAYFWREWYDAGKTWIIARRSARSEEMNTKPAITLAIPVLFACIPGGLAGILFENAAEKALRNPMLIAIAMITLGALLLISDLNGRKRRTMERITPMDWIIVGIAQALAIVPGVSRSGITITAGLFCGLQREAAAKFSFLIGAPMILGAALYELKGILVHGLPINELVPFLTGVLTATIIGYICIAFLLGYLKKHSAVLFVIYRLLFGIGVISVALIRK